MLVFGLWTRILLVVITGLLLSQTICLSLSLTFSHLRSLSISIQFSSWIMGFGVCPLCIILVIMTSLLLSHTISLSLSFIFFLSVSLPFYLLLSQFSPWTVMLGSRPLWLLLRALNNYMFVAMPYPIFEAICLCYHPQYDFGTTSLG